MANIKKEHQWEAWLSANGMGLGKRGPDHGRVGQVRFFQPWGASGTRNQSHFPLSAPRERKDSFHSESMLFGIHKDYGHCSPLAQDLGKTLPTWLTEKKGECLHPATLPWQLLIRQWDLPSLPPSLFFSLPPCEDCFCVCDSCDLFWAWCGFRGVEEESVLPPAPTLLTATVWGTHSMFTAE